MTAKLLTSQKQDLQKAASLLLQGDVVGVPTETVYGLAGSIDSVAALAKIFEVKGRPTLDPLIVHVPQAQAPLDQLASQGLVLLEGLSAAQAHLVSRLMERFWPGPLTLVLPRGPRIVDLVTSGGPTVAVRCPQHPVMQDLLLAVGVPLAAPSANRFGRISPTAAQHVLDELGPRIPAVIDGGLCQWGLESTVVALGHGPHEPTLWVLRPGGITLDQLQEVVGSQGSVALKPRQPARSAATDAPSSPALASPGLLDSHYAPQKPLILLPVPLGGAESASVISPYLTQALANMGLAHGGAQHRWGLLCRGGSPQDAAQLLRAAMGWGDATSIEVRSLDERGNPLAPRPLIMAQLLFSSLRELDNSSAQILVAEPCRVDEGLGEAMHDRLKRASRGNPF